MAITDIEYWHVKLYLSNTRQTMLPEDRNIFLVCTRRVVLKLHTGLRK